MAKSAAKAALATVEQQIPATQGAFNAGGLVVAGKDEAGLNLSRVVLYQGTPKEEEVYGKHDRGTFLDSLDYRALGKEVKIMPVFAFATWAVWEQGASAPAQTWTDQRSVPKDLLEWSEEGGKRIPPQAVESINVVCLVEGQQWPYVIVFKRTGLKAFNRTIAPLEARNASINKPPGLYALSSITDKNGQGQPFQRLTARPAGDPPAAMVALGLKILEARGTVRAKAEQVAADDHAGYDPNSD